MPTSEKTTALAAMHGIELMHCDLYGCRLSVAACIRRRREMFRKCRNHRAVAIMDPGCFRCKQGEKLLPTPARLLPDAIVECSVCGEPYPRTEEYFPPAIRLHVGFSTVCRECTRKATKDNYYRRKALSKARS